MAPPAKQSVSSVASDKHLPSRALALSLTDAIIRGRNEERVWRRVWNQWIRVREVLEE